MSDNTENPQVNAFDLLQAARVMLQVRDYAQHSTVDGYVVEDEALAELISAAHEAIGSLVESKTGFDPVETENGAVLGYLTICGLAFGALCSLSGLPPELAMMMISSLPDDDDELPGPDPDVYDVLDDDEPTVN